MADSEDTNKTRLSQLREAAEEQERLTQEIEDKTYKDKTQEELIYQQKQMEKVRKGAGFYRNVYYGAWDFLTNLSQNLSFSLSTTTKIIPPLNALLSGMLYAIELIEAIFISREAMKSRLIQGTNALLSVGLSIAAVVLTLNPATFVIGICMSAGAMGISTIKEGYFWYEASKDLRKEKNNKSVLKQKIDDEIHTHLKSRHANDIAEVKKLNSQIIGFENDKSNSISVIREQTQVWKNQKTALIRKIDLSVNQNKSISSMRNNMRTLDDSIKIKTEKRNEKRKSFFKSMVSFIGTALIALSVIAVVAAVLNPVGLGIAGVALLGLVTASAIKDKMFPPKPKPKIVPISHLLNETTHHLHISDTENIIHKLSLTNHIEEKVILKNNVQFYNALDKENIPKVASQDSPEVIPTITDSEQDKPQTPHL